MLTMSGTVFVTAPPHVVTPLMACLLVQAFCSRFSKFPQPREGFIVSNKDHFWFGNEWILLVLIYQWLQKQIQPQANGETKSDAAEAMPSGAVSSPASL